MARSLFRTFVVETVARCGEGNRRANKVESSWQPDIAIAVLQRTLLCFIFLMMPMLAVAGEPPSMSDFRVGLRAGFTKDAEVTQAEVAADYRLPWTLSAGCGLGLGTELQGAIGWVGDDQQNVPIGSLGGSVRLTKAGFPVSVALGFAPTLIGSNTIGGRDLGMALQFSSSAGVEWQITNKLALGYRFQHMSNGGFASPNQGLNLQMVSVMWRF